MQKFDFTKPFTITEFVQYHQLGDAHDPRVSKPIVKALVEKGYFLRVVKRERRWAKWPEFKAIVLPEIP